MGSGPQKVCYAGHRRGEQEGFLTTPRGLNERLFERSVYMSITDDHYAVCVGDTGSYVCGQCLEPWPCGIVTQYLNEISEEN